MKDETITKAGFIPLCCWKQIMRSKQQELLKTGIDNSDAQSYAYGEVECGCGAIWSLGWNRVGP